MKRYLLLFSLLFGFGTSAQQTGSFDLSIAFNETDYQFSRTLYFHVPSNYDANQSYKLVIGYRGGPHSNAGQFRDQLSFLSDSINAIVVCPENAAHFWNQEELTKQLFNYSLDTIQSLYSIDTNFIYLTGLSYGGRHSVIVSMDSDAGLLPKLRGVIPFAAGTDSETLPDYVNIAEFPPACVCIGLNDSQNFITISNTLADDIALNGGDVLLNEIPGVGHTVAFPSYPIEMMECMNYIESTYSTANIDEALELDVKVYPNPAKQEIRVKGIGDVPTFEYQFVRVDGSIAKSGVSDSNTLDLNELSPGAYVLQLTVNDQQLHFSILVE